MDFSLLFSGMGLVALLCMLVGLVFVIIEMFHPGFGAPGIVGAIFLLLGVILYARSLVQALLMILILIAILGIALAVVLQSATKGHLYKHLILHDSLDEAERMEKYGDMEYFVGSEGVTLTVLRPAGTADFNGVKLDVVSDGDFIPKDTAVRIIKVEGHRIVVKQINNK